MVESPVLKIEIDENGLRELKKLDRQTAQRIMKYLLRLQAQENPRELGAALHGPWSGYWKYRVGDYRLIAKIEDHLLRIVVIRIGHRSDVY